MSSRPLSASASANGNTQSAAVSLSNGPSSHAPMPGDGRCGIIGPHEPDQGATMPQVQTVRGPIDTSALGTTYMHEHVFVLSPDVQQNYPDEWGDEDTRVADAVAKLTALAAQGVTTIVDPTV